MPKLVFSALLSISLLSATTADQTGRVLFDFSDAQSLAKWQIVNDTVMGGRSNSKVETTEDRQMRFSGNLSLANNGGFASARSRPAKLSLEQDDVIVLRVQGDGRTYTFNLYVPTRRVAYSYQLDFKTQAGEWTEVKLPLSQFVAHSFGRKVPGDQLDANQVNSVGILLGDKNPGAFQLVVDWIKVARD
ncbi:MAG: CIA30 family protein [Pirellulaceae bacterium]|nr:CIA30 family protein [Pirellulaceae bacterium]